MSERNERLRALLAAATPRPWMKHGRHTVTANVRRWDIDVCKTGNVADGTAEADAELIAEAVNALPGLIAENERLRAALATVERKYQQWLRDDSQSRDVLVSIAATVESAMCSDCPPVGHSTDETRCSECPRSREALNAKG